MLSWTVHSAGSSDGGAAKPNRFVPQRKSDPFTKAFSCFSFREPKLFSCRVFDRQTYSEKSFPDLCPSSPVVDALCAQPGFVGHHYFCFLSLTCPFLQLWDHYKPAPSLVRLPAKKKKTKEKNPRLGRFELLQPASLNGFEVKRPIISEHLPCPEFGPNLLSVTQSSRVPYL